ncbi:MAG: ATP-binding cassette domain-containing protein, partial [Methylococcaceae bacterium]
MIEFDNVSKRYSDSGEALSEVNFSLQRGELAFLTGHSGAGKTTLLRLIAALERPSRGDILLDGISIKGLR